ncbi:hypothetical protein WJX72_000860 [[Myrmecia] bisecta]|uniref:FAD-binding PCMH-type domain-containing protein n=1 Tax=[Myrmecia] bisecta TaxID=41462 RepID=A0AAW1Q4F2_9CHLO
MEDGLGVIRESFRGGIYLPGEAEFESASKTWAKSALKPTTAQPAVVLRPRGTRDVAAALKFAQDHNLEVAVKSGGHCPRGSCWPNGGAVIDLSLMRSVYVDPIKRVAVAEGGCLLDDIDSETALHNLMVPLGHAPVTGMGLVVNGGFGVASKVFGATCDHVVSLQLVTAAGEVVTADADHNPDLFWAARGAGSAFGVVTKMTFRLHEVGPTFYGGIFFWPDDPEHHNFQAIATFIRDKGIPNPNLSLNLVRLAHPEMGPILISMVVYFGDELVEKKAEFLKPLRDLGPIKDTVGQDSYAQVQTSLLPLFAGVPPHYEYWASAQWTVAQATDDAIQRYATEIFDKLPLEKLPLTMFLYDSYCGDSMHASSSPIGMAGAGIFFAFVVGWLDPAMNDDGMAYAQYCKKTMAGLQAATDTYSNMFSDDKPTNGAESGLKARVGGEANLKRLRQLKKQWDPNNVFVNNPFRGLAG